jgi:hypothetical protein
MASLYETHLLIIRPSDGTTIAPIRRTDDQGKFVLGNQNIGISYRVSTAPKIRDVHRHKPAVTFNSVNCTITSSLVLYNEETRSRSESWDFLSIHIGEMKFLIIAKTWDENLSTEHLNIFVGCYIIRQETVNGGLTIPQPFSYTIICTKQLLHIAHLM